MPGCSERVTDLDREPIPRTPLIHCKSCSGLWCGFCLLKGGQTNTCLAVDQAAIHTLACVYWAHPHRQDPLKEVELNTVESNNTWGGWLKKWVIRRTTPGAC